VGGHWGIAFPLGLPEGAEPGASLFVLRAVFLGSGGDRSKDPLAPFAPILGQAFDSAAETASWPFMGEPCLCQK